MKTTLNDDWDTIYVVIETDVPYKIWDKAVDAYNNWNHEVSEEDVISSPVPKNEDSEDPSD
jgi:hypothetical protein